MRDAAGRIAGLTGLSRDIRPFAAPQPDVERVSAILDYARRHIDQPLPVAELAAHAGLSAWQLDQRVRGLFASRSRNTWRARG